MESPGSLVLLAEADAAWYALPLFIMDYMLRIGLSLRVIMRRLSVGVALSWIMIVLIAPIAGAVVYLLFGELRLGRRRVAWAARVHEVYLEWTRSLRERYPITWPEDDVLSEPLARLTESLVGIPTTPSNDLELIDGAETILRRLIEDIEAAQRNCHLEFYIWSLGGTADEVAEALLGAVKRGVTCRVLLDDVGSREFLRSPLARRLREGGVHLRAALPVGLFRMLFARLDLRLHRKIVVIDWKVAYTGSLNLVDPRYFKQDSSVGEWIDAMVRVQGPVVECLGATFMEDWQMETGERIAWLSEEDRQRLAAHPGHALIQVIPSGPLMATSAAEEMLLMAIYSARRELILTTPYFVPNEAMLTALTSAAHRGVAVTLILPARVDSVLVRLASQAHKDDLLEAGVRVELFDGGLLHTKSVTVDGTLSLFGSLNLDPRSLRLNFEITLAVYDAEFTARLRALQQSYLEDSTPMDYEEIRGRPYPTRLSYNAARLLAPLL
jgi:cardiolipin synthase A/B